MVISAGAVVNTSPAAIAQPVAEPAVPASPSVVSSRPDFMSAAVTARSQGSRVMVEELLEEASTTWVNPDGTLTTEVFTAPVRERTEAGGWSSIKLDLAVNRATGEVYASSPVDLELPGTESTVPATQAGSALGVPKTRTETDLASVAAGENGSVVLGWPGELPAADLEGVEATYADVAPGIDLQVTSQRSGFETFFVLDAPPAETAKAAWTLPLTLTGVTHRTEADGSISFLDPAGDVVSHIPTAWAWDSAIDPLSGDPASVSPVSLTTKVVSATGTGAEATSRILLTVTPDAAWLADPARQYPVTVDPTYASTVMSPEFDTYIQSDTTFDASTRDELRVGTFDGGATKARSLLSFNLDGIRGKQVQSAELRLRNTYSYSCTAREAQVWHTGGASASTRWSNQPTWHSNQGSATFAKGYNSSCVGGWVSIPMTGLAKTFAAATVASGVVGLRAASETDSLGWKKFASSETSYPPSILVTYNRPPSLPTSPAISGGASNNGIYYVNTAKPTLTTKATDPDGSKIRYDQQLFLKPGDDSTYKSGCSNAAVASGAAVSCAATNSLVNGTEYHARAKSTDELGLAGGWQGWTRFRTALTAPAAPTITCPGYADKTWTTTPPAADLQCTVTTSSSGYTSAVKLSARSDANAVRTDETVIGGRTMSITVPVSRKAGGHIITATATGPSGLPTTRTYTFGYGAAGIAAPADQATSSDQFLIRASAPPAGSATGITAKVHYRAADKDSATVPAWTSDTAVAVVSDPQTGGYVVKDQPWDATAAAEAITSSERIPALMQLRVCFTYTYASGSPTTQCTSDANAPTVLRAPHAFGDNYPVADTDAGQVALWTGEFTTTATDVDVATPTDKLTISRTHSTYSGPTTASTGIFGPGWSGQLDGPTSGLAGMTVVDATRAWGANNAQGDGTISLTTDDGEVYTWRQPGGTRVQDKRGTYEPIGEETELAGIGLALTYDDARATTPSAAMTLTFTDADGTRTTFKPTGFTTGQDTVWAPAAVTQAEDTGTTSYATDDLGRIKRILADVPDGTSCDPAAMQPGCRALRLEYYTATSTTSPGSYKDRLARVYLDAYDPAKAAVTATEVATYTYDGEGRLASVADPRTKPSSTGAPLATRYSYDGSTSRLQSITPPGLEPFTITYQSATNAAGSTRPRTASIQRNPLSSGGASSIEASFVYGLSPSGGNGLPDLSVQSVSRWGQSTAPTYGAAVFGPDRPVASTVPADIDSSAWPYAGLTYTDGLGYVVNTADFGPDGWQHTALDRDERGNVVREIDARGMTSFLKELAKSPGGILDADPYASITRYNEAGELTPAGLLVTDSWGPARDAVLGDGSTRQVRRHTSTRYDEGAPTGADGAARLLPYWLPTSTTTGVAAVESATTDPNVVLPEDIENLSATITGYGSELGGTAGWDFSSVTSTRTVMGSARDDTRDLITRVALDEDGRAVKTSKPASNGADDGTTATTFYTSAANPADALCGGKPQWDGLPCTTKTAATPASGNVVTTRNINFSTLLSPTLVEETSGTVKRSTRIAYLGDGRMAATETTTTGLSGSKAAPGRKYSYDPNSGLRTAVASFSAPGSLEGTTTGTLTTVRDKWGRVTSYTDTDGSVTTTTYVPPGRSGAGMVATVSDGKGSRTYGYGPDALGRTEHRSLATSLNVSDIGTYTAAYDVGGEVALQGMPGGLRQLSAYDIDGKLSTLEYEGPISSANADGTTSQTIDTWFSWSQQRDAVGRTRLEWTPTLAPPSAHDGGTVTDPSVTYTGANAYHRAYGYDKAARLTSVIDRTARGGAPTAADPNSSWLACQTRNYTFDRNGNRTRLAASEGVAVECPSASTGSSVRDWVYDSADRIADSGYAFDRLGRTVSVPAVDAPSPGAGAIALEYDHTDAVTGVRQGGNSSSFTYDAADRRVTETEVVAKPGGGNETSTLTRHYGSESDRPTWSAYTVGGSTIETRYGESLGGDLAATRSASDTGDTRVALSLTDPHGNSVATVPLRGASATGIDSWSSYGEYGTTSSAASGGGASYGWLGAHQREISTAGLMLMGDRVYNPAVGRFTSVDSVPGGNENAYNYPNDPIGNVDLDGRDQFGGDKVKGGRVGMGLSTVTRTQQRIATLKENARRGAKFEADMYQLAKKAFGAKNVDPQHHVRLPGGRGVRVIDLKIEYAGKTYIVELKTGGSRYKKSQRQKDEWMRDNWGWIPVLVRKW